MEFNQNRPKSPVSVRFENVCPKSGIIIVFVVYSLLIFAKKSYGHHARSKKILHLHAKFQLRAVFSCFRAIAWNSVISQPHQHTKLAELDGRRPQLRLNEKNKEKLEEL